MLKRLILLFFLLMSVSIFSQEKVSIKVYPSEMKSTSGVIITVNKKDNYKIKILNSKEELLFSKEIFITKVHAFKHDFSNYKKGKYTFILENNSGEVLKKSKIK